MNRTKHFDVLPSITILNLHERAIGEQVAKALEVGRSHRTYAVDGVAPHINNNFTNGVFEPLLEIYITTKGIGSWRLKGIDYQLTVAVEAVLE